MAQISRELKELRAQLAALGERLANAPIKAIIERAWPARLRDEPDLVT